MAVVAHVVLRGVSKEQYDAVRAEVGWLERTPAGGLAHLSWWEGDDNHNVDAWESEEAFEAFRNDPSVKETMRSSGTVGPPEFTVLKKVGEFPR